MHRALLILIVIFLALPIRAKSDTFTKDYQSLVDDINQHAFLAPRLDFASIITQLKDQKPILSKQITQWQHRLKALTPNSVCQSIAYDSLVQHLQLLEEREFLKTSLTKTSHYNGDFKDLNDAKRWYQHWLNSWLSDNVSPTQLKQIANEELTLAFAAYQAVKSNTEKEKLGTIPAENHTEIVNAFYTRQRLVEATLKNVLGLTDDIAQVNIAPSGLPESFPAPGIYNSQTQTFLYHAHNGVMNKAHLDWLYLHEALPGHHLQHMRITESPTCPSNQFMPDPFVSAEGWAAYIETLGEQFGLYQHPSSKAYALEWQVLRALRVLIDIGIHFENWTDKEAESLWLTYLPHRPGIMKREIKRIKNWPVQVITYVYGKHKIEQALVNYKTAYKDKKQKRVLNHILHLSNLPPLALNYLPQIIKQKM